MIKRAIALFSVLILSSVFSLEASQNKKSSVEDVKADHQPGAGRGEVFKQLDKAKAAAEKLKNIGKKVDEKTIEKKEEKSDIVDTDAITQDLDSFFTAFIYDPDNRRDPFTAPAPQQASEEKKSEKKSNGVRISSPEALKSFEASDYQVIGIMWGVSRPKALLLDPNQRVHTVYKDDEVGKRDGYIAAIKERGLVIVEPVIDTRRNAKRKFRTITLEVEE